VRRRSAPLAAAGALLVVLALLIVVGSQSRRHAIASNYVRPVTFIAEAAPGGQVCQPGERVPSGTGALELRGATQGRPGPRLELSVRTRDGVVRAVREEGWPEGDVTIAFPALAAGRVGADVCVRNAGAQPVSFSGGQGPGSGALVDGEPAAGAIRLTYLEGESRSWFAAAPEIGRRLDVVRDSAPGAATLPLFAVLALAVAAGAVALVLREAGR
jgi:hypothetical protein